MKNCWGGGGGGGGGGLGDVGGSMPPGQALQIIHGGIPLLNGIAHLDWFQLLQCYVESKQNQGMCTVFSLQLLCQWLLLHSWLESVFDWWNVI